MQVYWMLCGGERAAFWPFSLCRVFVCIYCKLCFSPANDYYSDYSCRDLRCNDVCLFFTILFFFQNCLRAVIFASTLYITNAMFGHHSSHRRRLFSFAYRSCWFFLFCSIDVGSSASIIWSSRLDATVFLAPFSQKMHEKKWNAIDNEQSHTNTSAHLMHTENAWAARNQKYQWKRWSKTFSGNSFVLTLWAISKVLLDREL